MKKKTNSTTKSNSFLLIGGPFNGHKTHRVESVFRLLRYNKIDPLVAQYSVHDTSDKELVEDKYMLTDVGAGVFVYLHESISRNPWPYIISKLPKKRKSSRSQSEYPLYL